MAIERESSTSDHHMRFESNFSTVTYQCIGSSFHIFSASPNRSQGSLFYYPPSVYLLNEACPRQHIPTLAQTSTTSEYNDFFATMCSCSNHQCVGTMLTEIKLPPSNPNTLGDVPIRVHTMASTMGRFPVYYPSISPPGVKQAVSTKLIRLL